MSIFEKIFLFRFLVLEDIRKLLVQDFVESFFVDCIDAFRPKKISATNFSKIILELLDHKNQPILEKIEKSDIGISIVAKKGSLGLNIDGKRHIISSFWMDGERYRFRPSYQISQLFDFGVLRDVMEIARKYTTKNSDLLWLQKNHTAPKFSIKFGFGCYISNVDITSSKGKHYIKHGSYSYEILNLHRRYEVQNTARN